MRVTKGGYEAGYKGASLLWGEEPGSLVQQLMRLPQASGLDQILDLGAGEGKNSAYFVRSGATVTAVEISHAAYQNGMRRWPEELQQVKWLGCDVRDFDFPQQYQVVLLYGICHCLENAAEVESLIEKAQGATELGGYHLFCAFDDGEHDMSAHPEFQPLLLPHEWYVERYRGWEHLVCQTDRLCETHPHNNIPHFHSLTRILAKRVM